MKNVDKLAAIDHWQDETPFHPLTCGKDSNHELLRGEEMSTGEVVLRCPTCGLAQEYVPDIVYVLHPG